MTNDEIKGTTNIKLIFVWVTLYDLIHFASNDPDLGTYRIR